MLLTLQLSCSLSPSWWIRSLLLLVLWFGSVTNGWLPTTTHNIGSRSVAGAISMVMIQNNSYPGMHSTLGSRPNRPQAHRRNIVEEVVQQPVFTIVGKHQQPRRDFFAGNRNFIIAILSFPFISPRVSTAAAAAATTTTTTTTSAIELVQLLQRAREQLDAVPGYIRTQQWDSIRAVLITPPLADCWTKTNRPLLQRYAESLATAGGDEFAALEGKEEVISHLRYLDMAAYNNVFNPIKEQGQTGATKGLIKSFYEDPINEWKASVEALDLLIKLADDIR